jgi:hypothetical protein
MMNVDDQYCLELLHRTIVQDAHARKIIQRYFRELLCQWLHCHPKKEVICQLNSEEHYITEALERFWQVFSSHQLEASNSLVCALRYLRISLNSTIMETLRMFSRSQGIPTVEIEDATEPLAKLDAMQCTCWEVIEHMLPNRRTHRLAYLLFYCGLKPKAIVSTYPQEFSDIQEIYRVWPAIAKQLSQVAIDGHKLAQADNTGLCAPPAP